MVDTLKEIIISLAELRMNSKKYFDIVENENRPVYIKRNGIVIAVVKKATTKKV